jgi:hypothetical protein
MAPLAKPAAKPAAAAKPALAKPAAKPTLAKPRAKAAAKPAAKPAAAAKPAPKVAKPKPETKPYDQGSIVVFNGYSPIPDPANPENTIEKTDGLFTPGEELAVVSEVQRDGDQVLGVVKKADYHAYIADPENGPAGEEILAREAKRTSKVVEAPFHLPVVGEMANYLKQSDGDPLLIAQKIFGDIEKGFFYFGGVMAKLYKEKGEDGKSLFTGYANDANVNYEDSKEGFEAFLKDNFSESLGGYRKVMDLIAIYESISSLSNAATVIKEISTLGWWKAQKLARFITDDNAAEVIEVAKTNNYDQMSEILKTSYTSEGGVNARGTAAARATIKKTEFAFKLFEDQGEGIEMILKAAQKQLGTTDLNAVFEHIVTEWAGDHLAEVAPKAAAAVTRKRNALVKGGVKLPADHPANVAVAAAA